MKKTLNENIIKKELQDSVYFQKSHDQTMDQKIIPHDTMVSQDHKILLEDIRKSLKSFGKEAATHRFTSQEKAAITDLIYSYKRKGIGTCENEITRIALNYILSDYKKNGEESILDMVLKLLND